VTTQAFLDRLRGVHKNGTGWIGLCPAHQDRNPSLSVQGRAGKILVKCFAGCSVQAICAAIGIEMGDLFSDNSSQSVPVAIYPYMDEGGKLLFEVLRYLGKRFRQRRPDGNGGWIWKLGEVRRVLYRLKQAMESQSVLIVEGEKDCDTANAMEIVATCNPGGAGKWCIEFAEPLYGKHIAVIADGDEPGRKHAERVAASLVGRVKSLKVLELPDAKDLTEWVERGGTRDALSELIHNVPQWKSQTVPSADKRNQINPWSLAAGMDVFLRDEDDVVKFLFPPLIVKGAVTEIFSPRGLGKSLWALFVAVAVSLKGYKVLLIDRDNPRRIVRDRLRSFGATSCLASLKVLSREHAPPLTNTRAWAEFPYMDYDLVIVDSLDSAAEGVGEQDSTKPSLAIAPLLDIARRENGPAVLLLGNTVKSAAHSRGSGVVEDRADVVFEVRDATKFHPTGKKPWIEDLPAADAGSWAARSTRRKRLSQYRLAFISTKFRIGEEPEPFIIEIDLATEPWAVRDVTDLVDREGAQARESLALEREMALSAAVELLKTEVSRREAANEPEILKKEAEELLTSRGIKQKIAREATNSSAFETFEIVGRGHPKGVRLADKDHSVNRNTTSTETTVCTGLSSVDFSQSHPERMTELDPANTQCLEAFQRGVILVEGDISTPHDPTSSETQKLSKQFSTRGAQGTEEEL
jgi:hypothetical protein